MVENMISLNEITKQAKIDFFNILKKSWAEFVLNHKRYTEQDARSEFFANFSALNLWLLVHLDTFSEMLDVRDVKIARYMNLNETSRLQYLSQHDTINRTTYVVKVMFDLEDFIKKLMKEIQPPKEKNYYDFTKQFLKDLGIYDDQKHKILNAPYQIRNSLHNNGYVYHNFDITLRGTSYKFIKGQRMGSSGWNNLYVFFDEMISLLIEIVDNPVLQKIKLVPQSSILES